MLIKNQYFALKKLSGEGIFPLAPMLNTAHLISVISGEVTLRGDHDPVRLTLGMSAFIPAALVGESFDLHGEILCAWNTL